jgi:type IV secretory pathway ATPase VirB11/archaellum biosynthesis ATPase
LSGRFERFVVRFTRRARRAPEPPPLLVELLEEPGGRVPSYRQFPFAYFVEKKGNYQFYGVSCDLPAGQVAMVRRAVAEASEELDPREVVPLTFGKLIEVLSQLAAAHLERGAQGDRLREIAELAAYEAVGLSRILAVAKDQNVTEFYVDSDSSPAYLDHAQVGRCESAMVLTARERDALQTHLDTFRGYTPDLVTPSLKNDLEMAGARLRISLDLPPVAVNGFALDVRRLNITSLSLPQLVALNVISGEAAALVVGWLESGGNCTIIGETGTGKTTLLNALDEAVEPKLRRLYIEDAVETRDMITSGYHQMKVKVDPFERGDSSSRTKESEIVKALHRSPDMVILSEIQSEDHSRAFFHSLAAGIRGIQTFHASSVEQAVRRWVTMHGIAEESLLDLGILVQMVRPDRLGPGRYVQRICVVASEAGRPRIRELFMRDRGFQLRNVFGDTLPARPPGVDQGALAMRANQAARRIAGPGASRL